MFNERRWPLYLGVSVLLHALILLAPLSMPKTRGVEAIQVVVMNDRPQVMGGGHRTGLPQGPSDRRRGSNGSPAPREAGPLEGQALKTREEPASKPPDTASRHAISSGEEVRRVPNPSLDGAGAAKKAVGGLGAGTGEGPEGGQGKGSGKGSGPGERGFGAGQGSGAGEVGFGSPAGPRFLRREMPEYPPVARRHRKEGTVVLMVTIDEHGRLTKVEVAEASDPLFVEPSVEAVKKSTFLPAMKNGAPAAVKAVLPIRFSLRNL